MYPKDILVTLLKDVIASYKITVNKLSKRREEQILKIKELCDTATYDTMIIHSVRHIAQSMDNESQGWLRWLYAPPSRLAEALIKAIRGYERAIKLKEAQQKHVMSVHHLITKPSHTLQRTRVLPSFKQINAEVLAIQDKSTDSRVN